VVAYVEDTSECGLRRNSDCADDCRESPAVTHLRFRIVN
jgi:hypothetical protein